MGTWPHGYLVFLLQTASGCVRIVTLFEVRFPGGPGTRRATLVFPQSLLYFATPRLLENGALDDDIIHQSTTVGRY